MRLTIDLPWFTHSRRLAVALAAVLLLTALALPASAAPPAGVSGEVTIANEETDPVPVAGSVDANVTGSVAAAQDGSWTVALDATASEQLTAIADATSGLTYDTAGNLIVRAPSQLQSSTGFATSSFTSSIRVVASPPATVSAISMGLHTGPVDLEVRLDDGGNFFYRVESPSLQTFPLPLFRVTEIWAHCRRAFGESCTAAGQVLGY
jgi:hypothetical protein